MTRLCLLSCGGSIEGGLLVSHERNLVVATAIVVLTTTLGD